MKKVFFSIMTALCGLIMNAAFVQAEMTLRENIEDKVLETVREQENIPSKAIAIFKTNHLLNQRKYHSVSVVCNAILRNYKEQDAESGNVEIVFDRERVEEVYKVKTDEEIYEALQGKIKEINEIMPKYKAIRGIILTETPLIKTTTNKIKRQANIDAIEKLKN